MRPAAEPPATGVERASENHSRIVWALAWPAVALNSLQVVNNLLDRGFIGHLEGAALTAQGASINVMFLMFSVAMALATATTAIVSRSYGAQRLEELRKAARQSLSLSVASGLLIAAVGAMLAPAVSKMLLPASDLRATLLMDRYLSVYLFGLPAIYAVQTLAGSLRGIGDTKSPMVISGVQILLHIALNFLLIFPEHRVGFSLPLGPLASETGPISVAFVIPGANLGLVGAALALTLSAWIAAIAYVAYAGRTALGSLWRWELPTLQWTRRILNVATPAVGMSILRVSSLWAFTLVLKSVANGSAAIAAMSIGFAIESIMFMPAFGLSVAAAALVGQSLGMERPDRAERVGWLAAHHSALVVLALSIPIFAFSHEIANLLVAGKRDIAVEASNLIRILCVTEVMFAYAMVLIGAMQGAGDTRSPMWITVLCLWAVRVPLAFLLAVPLGWGATGAWVSMSGTQLLQGILSILVFHRGKWKTQEV